MSRWGNGTAQDHPHGKGEHVLQNKDKEMEAVLTLETLSSAGPLGPSHRVTVSSILRISKSEEMFTFQVDLGSSGELCSWWSLRQ